MSSTITASKAGDLRSLLTLLASLGITKSHAKEVATVTEHLDAYDQLERLDSRARSFVAPNVDATSIQTRLAAGEQVPDAELIEYAAKATTAGVSIAPAAQSIIGGAQTTRVRSARGVFQGIFSALIEDLRKILTDAGEEPANVLIRDIQNTLKSIDDIAGRNQCDYWCMYNSQDAKWEILDRDRAEQLEVNNQKHAAEKKAQKERERSTPIDSRSTKKPARNLRRKPLPSSGHSDFALTTADVADYSANKAAGMQELTR